ncbi:MULTISPECIES: DUF4240 domain-containing protein [unclassified Streptomyces]|uniref:DUF4240 domain-containing protein n=1 Tax=unclassified Streptomyces TaxID=2593676 RepID=UPI00382055FF
MDTRQFWRLIDDARARVPDPADPEVVAARASGLLAEQPPERIVAVQQALWDLMAASYRAPLWAAAYLINGGCSDDGFDFRGWLITQGREVFGRAVSDPDSLAGLPAVRAACAATGPDLEGEATLGIAWDAYRAATGEDLPDDAFTIRYPDLDPAWRFDFGDTAEVARHLPALAAL